MDANDGRGAEGYHRLQGDDLERAALESGHEVVYCVQEPPHWVTRGIYRSLAAAEQHAAGIEGARVWPWIVVS